MSLREKIERAKEVREAANKGKEPPFGGFSNTREPATRCPTCGQLRKPIRWGR